MVEEISVEELKAQVDAGTAPLVIDVREGWELDISRLDFARHLPMGEVGARMAELDPQTPLVVMCRSGGRSMQVASFLHGRGFAHVANIAGGIHAWADEVDPSLPRY